MQPPSVVLGTEHEHGDFYAFRIRHLSVVVRLYIYVYFVHLLCHVFLSKWYIF